VCGDRWETLVVNEVMSKSGSLLAMHCHMLKHSDAAPFRFFLIIIEHMSSQVARPRLCTRIRPLLEIVFQQWEVYRIKPSAILMCNSGVSHFSFRLRHVLCCTLQRQSPFETQLKHYLKLTSGRTRFCNCRRSLYFL